MLSKIDIDFKQIYNDLMYLLETPGPTQACVKIAKNDPRINNDFPMEKAIITIIRKLNREKKVSLKIVRHAGNLVVVGGQNKNNNIIELNDLKPKEKDDIRKIPIAFGAHLDEISYMITKKKEDETFLGKDIWQIIPICAPPQLTKKQKPIYNKDKTKRAIKILEPQCKIVGFRNSNFRENIAEGLIYKVYKIEEKTIRNYDEKKDIENIMIKREGKSAEYLFVEITKINEIIKEGDFVIQDYGDWKTKKECKTVDQVITSKALDDRAGTIAAIYAVKELSKINIPSKVILTSAEEGVPRDVSWGRLIRNVYKEVCTEQMITLVCDGIDGKEMSEFNGEDELSKAVILPYTSYGKGGGDLGLFARFRDDILPELKRIYGEEIAITSTDYSSRSFEVKIMDDWNIIGFIQWSCGIPGHEKAICHNQETVRISQIVNIVRTMCHSFEILSRTK